MIQFLKKLFNKKTKATLNTNSASEKLLQPQATNEPKTKRLKEYKLRSKYRQNEHK